MHVSSGLRNKRTLVVGSVVGVLVAAGVFAVAQVRNTTTPVAAEVAIDRFESPGAAASEGQRDPSGESTASADREVPGTTSPPPPPITVATEAPSPGGVQEPEAAATDVTVPAAVRPAESVNATPLPLPEAGVYRLSVTGSESIDLLTGASVAIVSRSASGMPMSIFGAGVGVGCMVGSLMVVITLPAPSPVRRPSSATGGVGRACGLIRGRSGAR